MPIIEYVGNKPRKEDTVAGTGLIWNGKGDTHVVGKREAAMLLKHPDVWAEVEAEKTKDNGSAGLAGAKATGTGDDQGKGNGESQGAGGAAGGDGLDAMETDALKDLAKSRGISVGNSGRERILSLLRQAPAKSE